MQRNFEVEKCKVWHKAIARFQDFRCKLWLRYTLTYLLVMVIPFMAFSLFGRLYFNRTMEENIQSEMSVTLEKLESEFEQKIKQMINISLQISSMKEFKANSFATYSYDTRTRIIDMLRVLCTTSMFYIDIAYYHPALPKIVFTTAGTYETAYYRWLNLSQEDAYIPLDAVNLEELSDHWFTPQQWDSVISRLPETLLYFQPVPVLDSGCLVFEITETAIRQILPPVNAGSELYIQHRDRVLFPFNIDTTISVENGGVPARLDDGRYMLAVTSESSGLQYIYIFETSTLGSTLQKTLNSFMLLSILVGVICLLAITTASRHHAQPIEKLMMMAKDVVPADVYGIARLQSAMSKLQNYSRLLADMRMSTMRSHVLIRLIRGKYLDETEAIDNLHRVDIIFRQKWKLVMLLERKPALDETIPARVITQLSYNHDIYGFAYAEQSVFVMIVGMDTRNRTSLEQELEEIIRQNEFHELSVRFALGRAFETLISAHQSYMEALSVSRLQNAAPIAVYSKVNESGLFYPNEELSALEKALLNKDRNRTVFLYDVLVKLIRKNPHIYLYNVIVLSEMIQIYLQSQRGGNELQSYGIAVLNQNVNDAGDMLECLQRLHTQALQLMTQDNLVESTMEMTGIANYISVCDELDTLTVNALADRYGMHVSTLSHRFKEQLGCNISEYILTCKMNHACTLLRSTNETVAAIAEQVGYSQYTSFVRQFKRQIGATPTAYRDQWRSQNKNN